MNLIISYLLTGLIGVVVSLTFVAVSTKLTYHKVFKNAKQYNEDDIMYIIHGPKSNDSNDEGFNLEHFAGLLLLVVLWPWGVYKVVEYAFKKDEEIFKRVAYVNKQKGDI